MKEMILAAALVAASGYVIWWTVPDDPVPPPTIKYMADGVVCYLVQPVNEWHCVVEAEGD